MPALRKPFMAEVQRTRGTAMANGSNGVGASPHGPVTAAAPVDVDNTEVLEALDGLAAKMDRFLTLDVRQIDLIQAEIADISGKIKATKVEMAALRHQLAGQDTFHEAASELNAVVSATEVATNTIMGCAEELDGIVAELKACAPEGDQTARITDMGETVTRIYEACNFQDLTGQRITKVVRALAFIEERVDAMMNLWNRKEFEAMPLPPAVVKRDGDLALHGPAQGQESGTISQADIDALFG